MMYRKGEVTSQPLPLPDRVEMPEAEALATAEAFLAFMRRRHSVRQYSTRPVPEAVIAACIAAASGWRRWNPSARVPPRCT